MKLLVFILLLFVYSAAIEQHRILQVKNGDFSEVDRFLERYGYMSKTKSIQTHSTSERTNSLKAYQKYNGLTETGQLDEATVEMMNKPRCGVPDMVPGSDGTPKPFVLGTKWRKTSSTWMIRTDGFTNKLSRSVQRSEMARALKAWSDVSALEFREVSSNPDILIFFASGSHGDGGPFDGAGGTLAHAYFPENGDAHFDDDENWVFNRSGIDLFIVAAHEFGHSLGLDHSRARPALMAPIYSGYIPDFKLYTDDIQGIQSLYGRNVVTNPPTTVTTTQRPTERQTDSPTSSPTTQSTRPPTDPANPQTASPRRTPPPEPSVDNRPAICKIGYDDVIQASNGDYMFFVLGRYVLIMDDSGFKRARFTNSMFRGAPRRPNAVFTVPGSDNIYFVRGRRVYEFNSDGRRTRMYWIRGGMAAMPERPRAAFATNENEVNIFGRSKVWKFDLSTRRVVENSHTLISERFPGLPNRIDGAFNPTDEDTVHFFSGNKYLTFDLTLGSLLFDEPFDAASDFFQQECALTAQESLRHLFNTPEI